MEEGAAVSYTAFLSAKLTGATPSGFEPSPISPLLFPFQADLVRWALRRGRCAIFAATGLGKTRMQLEWAGHVQRYTQKPVLVLAPLAVAAQTCAEGDEIGVSVKVCREDAHVTPGLNVTNYERLHKFDCSRFGGVVLDESSCIKHFNSKLLTQLTESFASTAFKLCATATPAPNDFTELGTHAEFLGVCTRPEMLAEFFVHDMENTQDWRLKGHARKQFWRWVASWGALVRSPREFGYEAGGYDLPPLNTVPHIIESKLADVFATGELFPPDALSLSQRRAARKDSLVSRVAELAALVNANKESWIVWCDLNDESKSLVASIPGAVEVTGSDDIDVKEARLVAFGRGESRVLVTKPSIAGFGLNWQHCRNMAFVGLTDSWESYFQAIRRCWRFGQTKPVNVHVFASEMEAPVLRNLERKGRDAERMGEELSRETADMVRTEVIGVQRLKAPGHHTAKLKLPTWLRTQGA